MGRAHSLLAVALCLSLAVRHARTAPEWTTNPSPDSVTQPSPDWGGWATSGDDRFNWYLSHYQFQVVPNFTAVGYEVRPAPADLYALLVKELTKCYPDHVNEDATSNVVDTEGKPALFCGNTVLNERVLNELLPLHEEWSGVKLKPAAAFGFRIYQEGNYLKYHVDRVATHIVSSILHIDRDTLEPWPIHIINNTGTEHAVDIRPGQMMFYESARLAHQRPGRMKGRFYTSIFLHYTPVDWEITDDFVRGLLPQDWRTRMPAKQHEQQQEPHTEL